MRPIVHTGIQGQQHLTGSVFHKLRRPCRRSVAEQRRDIHRLNRAIAVLLKIIGGIGAQPLLPEHRLQPARLIIHLMAGAKIRPRRADKQMRRIAGYIDQPVSGILRGKRRIPDRLAPVFPAILAMQGKNSGKGIVSLYIQQLRRHDQPLPAHRTRPCVDKALLTVIMPRYPIRGYFHHASTLPLGFHPAASSSASSARPSSGDKRRIGKDATPTSTPINPHIYLVAGMVP